MDSDKINLLGLLTALHPLMNIRYIIQTFKWKFTLTLLLVLTEAGLTVLFPLYIGFAIDDALKGETWGSITLGVLGMLTLLVGAARRFYDSRFYARIFKKLGLMLSRKEENTASQKAARLSMLGEIVEFFENSVPELVNSLIGLVGTLIIIAALHLKIFFGCVLILVVVVIVYAFTRNKTISYNAAYNNEMERQVNVLIQAKVPALKSHLKDLMRWNVKLSDLETINFSIVWMAMMVFLVLSIGWAVESSTANYGKVFALVMYIFQYIESVITLPFFYQQWLRLGEISNRFKGIDVVKNP